MKSAEEKFAYLIQNEVEEKFGLSSSMFKMNSAFENAGTYDGKTIITMVFSLNNHKEKDNIIDFILNDIFMGWITHNYYNDGSLVIEVIGRKSELKRLMKKTERHSKLKYIEKLWH